MGFERAKAALSGTRFADLRWVGSTGSTNADLAAVARDGGGECALVADHQSAGRGRLDRRWDAPPGASLLMSVLVRPPFPATGPTLLPMALGVAVVDAIDELAGVRVGLKWPNDVVSLPGPHGPAHRKLGGMLAEVVQPAGGVQGGGGLGDAAVVLGIGVNLSWPDGFPDELADTATSVDLLGGRPVAREDLAVRLLAALDLTGDLAYSAVACELLTERYRERCTTLGQRVRVELAGGALIGTATTVTPDGALVVLDDDGTSHTVTAGDVVHLRPAA